MKKFKVTFDTGYIGGMLTDKVVKISSQLEAKDFEEAFRKAKEKEWHPDVYAKVTAIEEMKK